MRFHAGHFGVDSAGSGGTGSCCGEDAGRNTGGITLRHCFEKVDDFVEFLTLLDGGGT